MKEVDMKRQIGFKVIMGVAWLATAGAIGTVSAADSAIKDQAFTGPAQLDWTGLSSGAQMSNVGRLDWSGLSSGAQMSNVAQLDWTALSSQAKSARNDAANAYIGTSLTEPQAQDRLDWTGLSK
jgi:hypothetical protein